jgi:sugar-phosphatase
VTDFDGVLATRAILFDNDGTLVDSSEGVHRTWARWAERHGMNAHEIVQLAQGRRSSDTIKTLVPPEHVAEEVAWLDAIELEDLGGTVPIPGARDLLVSLPRDSWALVTSASTELAEARLRAAGLPIPSVLISSEAVAVGKPSPEGYLLGAARLGMSAADCVVAEDAPAGVAAGQAAGMRVIGMLTTHVASQLPGCLRYVADWRGVHVDVVDRMIALRFDEPPR